MKILNFIKKKLEEKKAHDDWYYVSDEYLKRKMDDLERWHKQEGFVLLGYSREDACFLVRCGLDPKDFDKKNLEEFSKGKGECE